jgi:hypothetical protein
MSQQQQLDGKEAILHKIVLEVRYHGGYAYLDRCGRVINRIQKERPGWLTNDGQTPQGSNLYNVQNGFVLNLNARKYDLSFERPVGKSPVTAEQVKEFADEAGALHVIIADLLDLKEFGRIGFRLWYLFASDSEEAAAKWQESLGYYSIKETLAKGFEATIDKVSIAVVLACQDRMCRLGLTAVERQEEVDVGRVTVAYRPRDLSRDQKVAIQSKLKDQGVARRSPEFGTMIDLDFYAEDPEDPSPSHFIATSVESALPSLVKGHAK